MALESCMILLDNSEFMRNGDYIPTRLEAQQDAANLLVGAKTQSNPESTVGVSAGTELLVSPTDDVGKILRALHRLPFKSGKVDVAASVQVASLALKHRRNKNGAQRIVLFVGSPITVETRALTKAGRQLKKNNVSIDVVAMGELEENEEKLRELVDAANGRADEGAERTCHLVSIPPGVLPSDVLASSPIVHGGGGGGGAFAAAAGGAGDGGGGGDQGGAFAEYGGVDPNMDPELAMALRVSMEEERARQERAAAEAAQESKTEEDAVMEEATTEPLKDDAAAETEKTAPAAPAMDLGLSEEEALLQQALAMSMNENEPAEEEQKQQEEDSKPPAGESMETEDPEDEDADMQMALRMSMQTEESGEEETKTDQPQFQDPEFVSQLLGSLPGVDPNDPAIQDALSNLNDSSGESKDESSKKDDSQDKTE